MLVNTACFLLGYITGSWSGESATRVCLFTTILDADYNAMLCNHRHQLLTTARAYKQPCPESRHCASTSCAANQLCSLNNTACKYIHQGLIQLPASTAANCMQAAKTVRVTQSMQPCHRRKVHVNVCTYQQRVQVWPIHKLLSGLLYTFPACLNKSGLHQL